MKLIQKMIHSLEFINFVDPCVLPNYAEFKLRKIPLNG